MSIWGSVNRIPSSVFCSSSYVAFQVSFFASTVFKVMSLSKSKVPSASEFQQFWVLSLSHFQQVQGSSVSILEVLGSVCLNFCSYRFRLCPTFSRLEFFCVPILAVIGSPVSQFWRFRVPYVSQYWQFSVRLCPNFGDFGGFRLSPNLSSFRFSFCPIRSFRFSLWPIRIFFILLCS